MATATPMEDLMRDKVGTRRARTRDLSSPDMLTMLS